MLPKKFLAVAAVLVCSLSACMVVPARSGPSLSYYPAPAVVVAPPPPVTYVPVMPAPVPRWGGGYREGWGHHHGHDHGYGRGEYRGWR